MIVLLLVFAGLLVGCDAGLDDLAVFEKDPNEIPLSQIITLSKEGTKRPLANGVDSVMWMARIHENAAMRTITFATTTGTFDSTASAKMITVRARLLSEKDTMLEARAILRSGTKKGTALVSASIGGFTARDTISFGQAFATAIRGETEKQTLVVGDRTVLTAILSRNTGSVTQGTEVAFSAEPSLGRFIGGATEKTARTDASGKATITFVTDTPIVQPDTTIRISMKTLKASSSDSLSHSITLHTKAAN